MGKPTVGDDLVDAPFACAPPGAVDVRAVLVDTLGWETSALATPVNNSIISSLTFFRTSSSVKALAGFAVDVEVVVVVVAGVVGCCGG